jgi:hypothetical protein
MIPSWRWQHTYMEQWSRSREMGVSWWPTTSGKSGTYIYGIYIYHIYIYMVYIYTHTHVATVARITTSHHNVYHVSMVQLGPHGPLDCLYHLSLGRQGLHIWLIAKFKQSRVEALWKLLEIVSGRTSYSFTVIICIQICC